MAIIEDAIFARLSTDSGLTALVSTRIYPMKLPDTTAYPAITYQCIDKIPASALGTASTCFAARFQFDCWGKTMSAVKNLANKLRNSLDALDTTLSGIRIYGIVYLGEFDTYEADTELYRISSDFKIMFTQT